MLWWVLGILGAAFVVWYVYGLITFRRGLVRANVLSYFIRRKAGDDHDTAMERVITSRYPESERKREGIRELYEDSHRVSPGERDDLEAVIRYMYAFETGRVLQGVDSAEFVREIYEEIDHYERRYEIPLRQHA